MGVAKGNRSSASGDGLVIVSLFLPAIVLFVTRNSIPFTTVMSGYTNLTIQADEYPKLVSDPSQTLADHYSNQPSGTQFPFKSLQFSQELLFHWITRRNSCLDITRKSCVALNIMKDFQAITSRRTPRFWCARRKVRCQHPRTAEEHSTVSLSCSSDYVL